MRSFVIAGLAALSLCGAARAAPDGAPAAQAGTDAKKDFDAVKAEFDKAMQEFTKSFRAAKTDEERDALRAKAPAEDFVPRFQAIADKNPTDPAAADCLAWIVQNSRRPQTQAAALEALLAKHASSPSIGKVAQSLAYSAAPNAEKFLRAVAEKNADRETQGQAWFGLARLLQARSDLAGRLRSGDADLRSNIEKTYGREFVASLDKLDVDAANSDAEKAFACVAEKYADVKSGRGDLGAQANDELFQMRTLGVGKPAPEIVGADVDGKPMKLSDFRGKVVVLDFMGFW